MIRILLLFIFLSISGLVDAQEKQTLKNTVIIYSVKYIEDLEQISIDDIPSIRVDIFEDNRNNICLELYSFKIPWLSDKLLPNDLYFFNYNNRKIPIFIYDSRKTKNIKNLLINKKLIVFPDDKGFYHSPNNLILSVDYSFKIILNENNEMVKFEKNNL